MRNNLFIVVRAYSTNVYVKRVRSVDETLRIS
jgi:hypothetical protein